VFPSFASSEYSIFAIGIESDDAFRLRDSCANGGADFQKFEATKWVNNYATKHVSPFHDLYLVIDRFAFDPSRNATIEPLMNYLPFEIERESNSLYADLVDLTGSLPWFSLSGKQLAPVDLLESSPWYSIPGKQLVPRSNKTWPDDARIAHAFSRIVDRRSRLFISVDSMIVVISFNLVKVAILLWILVTDKSEYLVTIGDAVASFLERPDTCTIGQCMLGKEGHLFKRGQRTDLHPQADDWERFQQCLIGTWLPNRLRYSSSLPDDRQIFLVIL
jgi:hypothetical protein